ncbi:hypothetical protein Q5O24_01755 [Eubacteriaceae bacterium ES3]|nr:hypothetical protein Q5O24_01755 [Eubacteriaceae bacterium ES3]
MSAQIKNRDYSAIKFYLCPAFMQAKTNFKNLDNFFSACDLEVYSQESFDAIPPEIFDQHVQNTTSFEDFNAFMSAALDFSFESQLKGIKL